MKSLKRFLLAVFSCVPVVAGAAPIAQTAGSNLTQYNGSMGSVVGNQWNNATNPRNNAASPKATADFGNCNSLILRCASPKCSGGGCVSMDVAKSIVAGCVNSNDTCKKHGDALIDAIAGQLVADSVAEQNRQAANAAAANAAAEQNNAALQQQLASMQQQMASMQQQNSAQIDSLQQQLAESQRSNQDAISAAAAAASAQVQAQAAQANPGTGLTAAQEAAAKSGVSDEVIARATITGQILTGMEGVDSALNNLKTTMRDAFRYAKCNEVNGNNCSAPKRVAKFRELANKFFEPYDALSQNLEDSLFTAQSVGVDLGNIYMFFSGTCNRWAEYVCRGNYEEICAGTGNDRVCTSNWPVYSTNPTGPVQFGRIIGSCDAEKRKSNSGSGVRGGHDCADGMVIPPEDLIACTPNKYLDLSDDAITEKILNPDASSTGSVRVGCASDSINNGILRRRRSSGKSASGIDIDLLEILINQNEAGAKFAEAKDYCAMESTSDKTKVINDLKAATVSKALKKGAKGVCCAELGQCNVDCYDLAQDVAYVDPVFALCDTHAWNAGFKDNDEIKKSEDREKMNEIIALKTTVIAQQMYKQYASLEQIIKQLKVMLEKEVLKASVQVAGGTSSDDDTSTDKVEFDTCSPIDEETALSCLRSNYSKLQPYVTKKNLKNNVKKQLTADSTVLKTLLDSKYTDNCKSISTNNVETCFNGIAKGINDLNKQIQNNKRSNSGGYIYVPGNNNG